MRYGLSEPPTSRFRGIHFPVQSSVLDEEALVSSVLSAYRIRTPISCRFLTRGDSDIYRVKTATDSYYLKVYRPPQSRQSAEGEASFVMALAAAEVPVVRPVPRNDGCFAHQVAAPEGERPMLLFEEAPPPLPSRLDESLLARAGAEVASLHAAADELDGDLGLGHMQWDAFLRDSVHHTSRFLSERDKESLERISADLGTILAALPNDAPEFGPCHGDLVLSNLRLAMDGTITFLDFGNALATWRAYELATIRSSLGSRHEDRQDSLWRSFLEGYESVRPLPEVLREHLSAMMILRQISFLGGNCATLPLRLGTEPLEAGFIQDGMERLRALVEGIGTGHGE